MVEASQYPPSSPPPNFQRPGAPGATPAPVYFAGAEIPSQPSQPPAQAQQQQPPQQQYAQRPPEQRLPSGGKQPAPLQTSASPPPANQYASYQPPQSSARPQSTYGSGPQELSTSVYDSPIAPHNANPAGSYSSSSAYNTPDDPYTAASPPMTGAPSAPSAPGPGGGSTDHHRHPQQPSYGHGLQYSAYHAAAPSQQPPQAAYAGYEAAASSSGGPGAADGVGAPPASLSRPPPGPLSPPPLQPTGPAYDARQSLPSRVVGGGEPQYRAYVPPSAAAGGGGGGGGGSGGPGRDEGPSAPAATAEGYYRTAAY